MKTNTFIQLEEYHTMFACNSKAFYNDTMELIRREAINIDIEFDDYLKKNCKLETEGISFGNDYFIDFGRKNLYISSRH